MAKTFERHAESYYQIRAIEPKTLGTIARSARFLYLNRLCFNGLYRTNGSGAFNVPIGKKTGDFPSEANFRNSVRLLQRAQLIACDFQETLAMAKDGDFVYVDPPYASRLRVEPNEYGFGSFSTHDIPRLITSLEALHARNVRFLLSYSYSDDLLAFLPQKTRSVVTVQRHIAARPAMRRLEYELLLDNADLFSVPKKRFSKYAKRK